MTLEINRIHNMPCTEMFAGLTEQAALIVADPPYGVSYKSSWATAMKGSTRPDLPRPTRKRAKVESFGDDIIDTSWLPAAYNALRDGSAMYLFTRWDVLHTWHQAAQEAGFKPVQRIIWDKGMWGAGDLRYYGTQTEDIIVYVKGVHCLRWDQREGNVWYFSRGSMYGRDLTADNTLRHPTQKPVRLMQKIITYSSDKDDLILDPFTGSGAACIAAQRLHRRFIGTDISPTFAQAANEWLAEDRRTNAQTRMKPMFEAML